MPVQTITPCNTAALSKCLPYIDSSTRLGIDIGPKDNHHLYLTAAEWIGTPYRSGGHTQKGTDCSGMTGEIYRKVYHMRLPRSTSEQMKACRKVSRRELKEGDLVFFHVGIYLKDGYFVHASTSRGVIVSHLDEAYYRRCWLRGGRP